MKPRTRKVAVQHSQPNEPDGLWEPEDIQPEPPKPPKPKPKDLPVSCGSIRCTTRLASILRDSLDPKYRGRALLMPSGIDFDIGERRKRVVSKLIPNRAAAERKLGSLMVDAFLTGDKDFPDEVRKAMMEVDAIFNRKRLVELTRRIMPFSHKVDGCKTKEHARKLIEARIGKKLYDQEWDRLQKHFGWHTLPLARKRSSRR